MDSRSLNLGDAAQKPKAKPFEFKFKASGDRSSVGLEAGGGLGEGKRLEAMVWGSGGAVIGSLAGPVGAMIGAAAGAAAGLFVAIFIVPHNGPEERR